MMLGGIIQLRKPDVVCPVSDEAAVCVRARTCVCVCVCAHACACACALKCMHMHVCTQSCPTLCGLVDCSPPGSSVQGISRQEYWSGLPFPSPGDLPNPGIKPVSLVSPASADEFFTTEPLGKPCRTRKLSVDQSIFLLDFA